MGRSVAEGARDGAPGSEGAAVELAIQDTPVSPLVELAEASRSFGGKLDVIFIKTVAPKCRARLTTISK